jgi:hypothetical protein
MDEIDIKILEKGLSGTTEKDMEYIKGLNTGWKEAAKLPSWDAQGDSLEELSASDRQVGGDHYKDYEIQPGEYCQVNRLPYMESNAIKYITRHGKKHNGREDIEKAIHCLELVLEWDYDE